MRSRIFFALILLGTAFACASHAPPGSAPNETAQPPAPQSPSAEGDPVFLDDFTRLRTQYGEREDFRAVCEDDRPLHGMIDAANAAHWQDALDVALPWLTH